MLNNFEEKVSSALKSEAEKINPSRFLLSKILDNRNVTFFKAPRYNRYKGVSKQLINRMNTKLKVLVPAVLAVVILVGGVYALRSRNAPNNSVGQNSVGETSNSQQAMATPNQNSDSAVVATKPSNAQIQAASSDPDVIYNEMMSEANSEQASSQQGDAAINSAVSSNNQDVQQLNNSYNENQF